MNDIQKTLEESNWNIINMSAGNPVVLPELETFWRQKTREVIDSEDFWEIVGRYGSTKWYWPLLEEAANFANRHYVREQWGIWGKENILVTWWSQSLYFFAVNAFAWKTSDWKKKRVLLPQSPDYTGYWWMWLEDDMFISSTPQYELDEKNKRFVYKIDTSSFPEDKSEVGVIILSRPCNPTGNIITAEELKSIYKYVDGTDIPVLLDSAYASPVPALVYEEEFEVPLHPNVVVCMSFSKAWLPWERVGVAFGDTKFLSTLEAFEANVCIMSSRLGQAIIANALKSGELETLSKEVIQPYYKAKSDILKISLNQFIDKRIPYFLHEVKWWMFGFIYFESLPITDEELYERLKERGVLFVPGNSFFVWINTHEYHHAKQCMRISITVSDNDIRDACKILWNILEEVYNS